MNVTERIERLSIPEPNSGCWIWLGALDRGGYARISLKGKNRKASRVSYQQFVGELTPELDILHICDLPACVNPAHLRVGTAQDNIFDMWAKGRGRVPKGEAHSNSILTLPQATEIRSRVLSGENPRLVALDFDISRTTAARIASGKSWRQI